MASQTAVSTADEIDATRRGFLPSLSADERDRRWSLLREMMLHERLEYLLVIGSDAYFDLALANFRYITQIGSKCGGFCIFPLDGEPVVFNNMPHMNVPYSILSVSHSWVSDIRPNVGVGDVVDELRARGFTRGRIGIVTFNSEVWGNSLRHVDHRELVAAFPGAELIDVTAAVELMRVIKSAEEVEMLRGAGELAAHMLDAMRGEARPGILECELWADMLHSTISRGGEPTVFNLLLSGPLAEERGRQHLLHGVEQPSAPSKRLIEQGDLIVCEFHSNFGGYLAGAEHSVVVGKAPSKLRRVHEVAVECLTSGVEKMRAGVTVRELVDAIRAPAIKARLDWVELGFHGHGLSSPEIPAVVYKEGSRIAAGRGMWDVVLREGMVLSTNVDIFDPDWRTDVGVMLGGMVHVTDDKPDVLVDVPKDLVEVA